VRPARAGDRDVADCRDGADRRDGADPAAQDRRAWLERLFAAGMLYPTTVPGLYGRSGKFEALVAAIEAGVRAAATPDRPEVRRFAPVMPTEVLVRSGYPRSFPDLVGTVHSFSGGDAEHAALLSTLDAGGDWTAGLGSAGTALCAAACQPLYPTLAGSLPPGGRRFDVNGWVFRHEPSADPARQQSFRQYEVVYVGDAESAQAHRDRWRERAAGLLGDLGLDVSEGQAHDPFFGRAGRLLAASQAEAGLKFELTAATGPKDTAAAVASANCHRDHFGAAFGITTADGEVAHSACVGFGLERIALALLFAHGLDPHRWPPSLTDRLEPGG
jgi:seryl-tRNA synthetase